MINLGLGNMSPVQYSRSVMEVVLCAKEDAGISTAVTINQLSGLSEGHNDTHPRGYSTARSIHSPIHAPLGALC